MAFPSDLVRTKNWGTEVLTDSDLEGQFDLIINWVMAALNSTTGHAHDGTSNQGPKISASVLTISSQAQGDILYASSSSAWARLGAGTSGQFLKTQGVGANPTWATVNFQTAASQSDMETASSNTVPVTPLSTKWHPAIPKAWVVFNGTGTPSIGASYNVTSITDNGGTGDYKINFTTSLSSTNYSISISTGTTRGYGYVTARAVDGVTISCADNNGATLIDQSIISVIVYGDF